jgi:hypothetical protein
MRALLGVGLALSLCAFGAQAQNTTRTKRGDTIVVTTQGNGKWGPAHDAIEVLRLSGETRETTFGQLTAIEATPDGGVIVVDAKSLDGLIIRHFDANGKFVRNIGRKGRGPGEYDSPFGLSIAAHANGSVYLRDGMRAANVYAADGKILSSFALAHNNGSTGEITPASDGSMYLRAPFGPNGFASVTGTTQRPMLHYSVDGKLLDSISTNVRWVLDGVDVSQRGRLLPDGRLLVTRTDKVGFLIRNRQGQTMIAETPAVAVTYLREERDELMAGRKYLLDKCGEGMGTRAIIPEFKPPARASRVDIDGRVWIGRSTTSKKIPPTLLASCGNFKAEVTFDEPPAFAGFLQDGTYLGEVRFPVRTRVSFVGNYAWAILPDADDVPTLVKYRLY